MDTKTILADLRSERDRLNQAIAALEALAGAIAPARRGRKPGTLTSVPTTTKKRRMSAAGRKRIPDAQKKRWAANTAAEKKPATKAPDVKKVGKKTAPKTARKRLFSPESRQRMAAAQQKRWAKKKRAVKAAAKKAAAPVATAAAKETPKT